MTTPNHQAELLPCPFCGSDFKVQQEPYDNGPMRGLWFLFHEYGPLGSPARQCRVEVPVHFGTKAEAIAFWNTRPASHEAELVEALEACLGELYAPEPSCSCHISPPCMDCVDYASVREVIDIARATLAKTKAGAS